MLTNNYTIASLAHDDIIKILADKHGLTLAESAEVIKQFSFKEYLALLEAPANVPSPSGNAQIGGLSNPGQVITPVGAKTNAPNLPAAAGTSYKPGDQASVKNAAGGVDDVKIVNQDIAAGTVSTINSQTGKEEIHNLQDLSPSDQQSNAQIDNPFARTLSAAKSLMQSHSYEDKELSRILELAGIAEDASCGATGAGSIASIAKPLGGMHKRKQAEESGSGNIHGKIDPSAATGELSRRLADRGMNTASRKNNGKKST